MKKLRCLLAKILSIVIGICMILTMMPAMSVKALSLQEQAWLSALRPKMPKVEGGTSYPAELIVSVQKFTVTMKGTCALEGEVTDEQLIDILKQAASAVDEYKSPEDAVNDKRQVSDLKGKLKQGSGDINHILENWAKLAGVDKEYAILHGALPDYGVGDVIGAAGGKLNIPGLSTILSVLQVSWDEYQRDQERWNDITSVINANARLRKYNEKINELLRDEMSKNMGWTIRIYDQQIKDTLYREAPAVTLPVICNADIELKKNDGEFGSVSGTYSGYFKFKSDVDMSDYDANFHRYLADYLNGNMEAGATKFAGALGARAVAGLKYEPVSQTVNRPSESKYALGSDNVYLTLSLPEGVNRTVFELPIDTMALTQEEYVDIIDMVSVLKQETDAVLATHTWVDIEDSESGTYYMDNNGILKEKVPPYRVEEYSNPESGSLPTRDIRPYISMTLVVNMLEE